MMKTKLMRVVALVSITLSMTAVVGTLGVIAQIPNEATAQEEEEVQEFDAILAGAFEVPPVQTNASGFADLDVEMEDGQRVVDYHLYVSNIERVTQAHIHQGNSSENGPIIVPLFNASSTPTGPVTGQLAEGHITPAKFVGPLQGKQLDDLIALMQNQR